MLGSPIIFAHTTTTLASCVIIIITLISTLKLINPYQPFLPYIGSIYYHPRLLLARHGWKVDYVLRKQLLFPLLIHLVLLHLCMYGPGRHYGYPCITVET